MQHPLNISKQGKQGIEKKKKTVPTFPWTILYTIIYSASYNFLLSSKNTYDFSVKIIN